MVYLRKQRFCGLIRAKRSIACMDDQGDGRVTTGGGGRTDTLQMSKKKPLQQQRQGLKRSTKFLERYPQRKHRAEGFARPDAWRSVEVANRIGDLARAARA